MTSRDHVIVRRAQNGLLAVESPAGEVYADLHRDFPSLVILQQPCGGNACGLLLQSSPDFPPHAIPSTCMILNKLSELGYDLVTSTWGPAGEREYILRTDPLAQRVILSEAGPGSPAGRTFRGTSF